MQISDISKKVLEDVSERSRSKGQPLDRIKSMLTAGEQECRDHVYTARRNHKYLTENLQDMCQDTCMESHKGEGIEAQGYGEAEG